MDNLFGYKLDLPIEHEPADVAMFAPLDVDAACSGGRKAVQTAKRFGYDGPKRFATRHLERLLAAWEEEFKELIERDVLDSGWRTTHPWIGVFSIDDVPILVKEIQEFQRSEGIRDGYEAWALDPTTVALKIWCDR